MLLVSGVVRLLVAEGADEDERARVEVDAGRGERRSADAHAGRWSCRHEPWGRGGGDVEWDLGEL